MKIDDYCFPLATLFLLLMLSFPSMAQEDTEAYQKEQFVQEEDTLKYRILYPERFSEDEKYPVLLFLHGAGERGDDNEAQLIHGGDLFLEKRKEFPAIVVVPQAPRDDYWAQVEVNRSGVPLNFDFNPGKGPTTALKLVMGLMDSITSKPYADNRQIYVGGMSMGGMGTFELLFRKPDMFAAAFAICGAADPEIVKDYPKNLNIWLFHGEKDNVVPPVYSKMMAREINSKGGNAKLSLYPNDNHNSWDSAFAEPYLFSWLYSNVK